MRQPDDDLPAPVLFDARTDPLAAADPGLVKTLRDEMLARYTRLALPGLAIADAIAARWLARTPSPYRGELDTLVRRTGLVGLYAMNVSYESGCTARMLVREDAPLLLRALDWPFDGMGRHVIVLHREGPAGAFHDVTWPGAVGTLTACAPGRFAASINQAPLRRRTRITIGRPFDIARNLTGTLLRARDMPSMHLLRHVFETAPDFEAALDLLTHTPIARPTLFCLVGTRPDETALIERLERSARVLRGARSIANHWTEQAPGWEARSGAPGDRDLDSRLRAASIAGAELDAPFSWITGAVLQQNLRVSVEACPKTGMLRVAGWERDGTRAVRATGILDLPGMPTT